jgi:hypothetical protein
MIEELQQDPYIRLIEQLLQCPNGQEPEVLDAHPELINADLVQTMVQVASGFAHHDNPDAARFLVHVARELSKQLGLYPPVATEES